jgi:hypothetical protein
MKKLYLSLILFCFFLFSVSSQPFTSVSNPFPGLGRCAAAFADFDNDNDLDLIMSGQDNNYNPVCKIFENTNGEFTAVDNGLKGLYNCALSVADYNHDHLMDFVITGQGFTGNKTYLYRNTGSNQFMLADSTIFAAGADGDVAFGDYDNDGFVDIALSGNWQSKLYHNNNDGTFSETQIVLPGLNSPAMAWGDCDNDGDQDLLMAGDNGTPVTLVLKNESGIFNDMHAHIDGAVGGDAGFGDYDMDGVLDVLVTGKDSTLDPVSYIFRNKGDNYINASAGFVGTALGPADFIDYDNDGDPDVMLGGQNATCGTSFTRVYSNDGIGGYTEFPAGFAFAERSASAWGDYDNDGDLDMFFAGISGSPVRFLYRNDLLTSTFQPNTLPSIPEITDLYVYGSNVVINWDLCNDAQTPSAALTYNLRVGTTPGGIDVVSPNADPLTGVRYVPAAGNQSSSLFAKLKNLQPGTYYFALQTIDQSFAASPFSAEQSFIILPTGYSNQVIGNQECLITREGSNLHISTGLSGKVTISLLSIQGRELQSLEFNESDMLVPVAEFPKGIYILKIQTSNGCLSRKIML